MLKQKSVIFVTSKTLSAIPINYLLQRCIFTSFPSNLSHELIELSSTIEQVYQGINAANDLGNWQNPIDPSWADDLTFIKFTTWKGVFTEPGKWIDK